MGAFVIRQLLADPQGNVVLLSSMGVIYSQRSAEGDPQRKDWVEVDMTGLDDARVVELAVRMSGHDGQLVARVADGRLFEQHQPLHTRYGTRQWRELAGPETSL